MLKIQEFIIKHKKWEQLLSEKPYCLKISHDCGVVGFMYNMLDSDFSEKIVQEARGLWLYEDNFEVACHSFDKFFNYGEEHAAKLDWDTVEVQEKIDGSLMKLWFNKRTQEWMLSTNGTIDSRKALTGDIIFPTFYDVFQEALKNNGYTWESFTALFSMEILNEQTYTFELVSPMTRVVIPYEKPDIYFIGGRANESGEEFSPRVALEYYVHIKTPKTFRINTLEAAIEAASKLPWDEEGYVAVDENFNRVKIKSSEWVKAHYVRNNNTITRAAIVDTILKGDQEEFLLYAADYKPYLEDTQNKMKQIYEMLKNSFYTMMNIEQLTPKDYAQMVQKQPRVVQDYLFKFNNGELAKSYLSNWSVNKWCDTIEQFEATTEENNERH